jgi:hypothetical protein
MNEIVLSTDILMEHTVTVMRGPLPPVEKKVLVVFCAPLPGGAIRKIY